MKLSDKLLYVLSFGTRVPLKPAAATTPVKKPADNLEAGKLALRVLKGRQRFKALKADAIKAIDEKNATIDLLSTYLLVAIAKNDGTLLVQKDVLDTMKAKLPTLGIKTIPVEDSPGDITLKIVDMSKNMEDLQKKFAAAMQAKAQVQNEE